MSEDQESNNPELREADKAEEQVEDISIDESKPEGEPENQPGDTESIESLKEELGEAKDKALRAQAEMENIRRRAEKDVEKAHKFALDRFAGDIIVVADNLERALTNEEEGQKEGLELTLKSLLDTLEKHGVTPLDPQGEPFDPQVHEAIAMVPNPDMEPDSVMEVMQKGYSLNGRVIRPARVVVVKGE